jgi:hypothetical protein
MQRRNPFQCREVVILPKAVVVPTRKSYDLLTATDVQNGSGRIEEEEPIVQ